MVKVGVRRRADQPEGHQRVLRPDVRGEAPPPMGAGRAPIGEGADVEAAAREVLRTTVELLGADCGALYRWDPAAGVLRRLCDWQVPAADRTRDLRRGQGLAGQVFYQDRPLIVNDYPVWEHATDGGRLAGLRAGVGVPLSRGGKLLGVLLVLSYREGTRFGEDDARLVALLGDQAAAALFTAEAFEQQRRAALRSQALLRLARRFAAEDDPDQLLSDLLAEAVKLLGGDDGAVSRWEERTGRLVPLRRHAELDKPLPLRPGQGASGRAIQHRAAVILNDYQRECALETGGALAGVRASVAVPLQHAGRLLGVLAIHSYEEGKRFTGEEAEVLELLAGIVSATLVRFERVQLEGVRLAARTAQHELSNKLALATGYAELLVRDPALPPHLREAAVELRLAAESAAKVLDQLQRITKLEKKTWGPPSQPTIDIGRSIG